VRVRSLRIDGFGIHRDLVLGPLAPGVQVIAGPNEAGKSTLLAFLRWMLFAPWSGRGVNPPLPPLRGGAAGGEMELAGPGGTWRLARHTRGTRRDFRVVRPDGTEGGEEDLAALVGGTTLDLFRKVFLFDLADLAEIGRLGGESLEGRLLAAGMTGAGAGARELAGDLSARARELAAPRGDCRVKRLLDRQAELAAGLRELREAAAAAADRGEERAIAAEIESLREERRRLAARRSFLAAVEELAAVRARAAALERERAGLPLDDRLHRLAPALGELERDLSAARAAREELRELDARRKRLEERARGLLGSLGEDWNRERLEALPPSGALREEALRLARARDEARERLRDARAAATAAREREGALLAAAPAPRGEIADRLPWGLAGLALALGGWLLATRDDPRAGFLALLVALVLAGLAAAAARRRHRALLAGEARRETAAADRARAEEAVRDAERRAEAADAAWEAFLRERGLPGVDDMDGLLAFLDRAREARTALAELDRLDAHRALRERRVAAWCEAAGDLLERAGVAASRSPAEGGDLSPGRAPAPGPGGTGSPEGDDGPPPGPFPAPGPGGTRSPAGDGDPLPRLAAAVGELSTRVAGEARARARAAEIAAALGELEARERELVSGRDPDEVERALAGSDRDARRAEREAIETRLGELDATLAEHQQRLGALRAERERLERDTDLPALEQELRSVEEELAEAVAAWQRLALGEALVREALRRFRERHQPAVLRRASRWLDAMTGGRHRFVRPREEGDGLEIGGPGGTVLGPDELSRGTREQLWLALRLALAVDVAARGPAPPLVLDDVLVDFDPTRRAAAARVLADVGREVQVLVLTCHPDLADLLAREAQAAVAELPSPPP